MGYPDTGADCRRNGCRCPDLVEEGQAGRMFLRMRELRKGVRKTPGRKTKDKQLKF